MGLVRLRRRVLLVLGFVLGATFVFLVVRGIDWSEIRTQLGATSPGAILGALAFIMASAVVRAVRWRMTWVERSASLLRLFLVENASLGLNNISPIRVLDEPAIVSMLSLRDRLPASKVLASVVMTRLLDLVFTVLFAVLAVLTEPKISERALPAIIAAVAFMSVFAVGLSVGRLARVFPRLARVPGLMDYADAVGELWRRKLRLGGVFGLTILYWLLLGPAAYVLAQAMDVEVSLFQATILALGAVFFATAAPGLPGAVGTFEIAVVEIVGLWGVDRSAALGFALVLHLLLFMPPVVIAFFVLPREGIGMATGWKAPRPRPPTA